MKKKAAFPGRPVIFGDVCGAEIPDDLSGIFSTIYKLYQPYFPARVFL